MDGQRERESFFKEKRGDPLACEGKVCFYNTTNVIVECDDANNALRILVVTEQREV